MKLEEFVFVDGKKMRCGYTTGTCALAATKAALESLKINETIFMVRVSTPAGIDLELDVQELYRDTNKAKYSIIKDSGDDPDITHGIEIISTIELGQSHKNLLKAGHGVGIIRKKGLFGEIGEPAINPVPKKLLLDLLNSYHKEGLSCTIEVPKGEEIAKKTFNPYMGIEGGISILGTKGIVYPMSKDAYVKSMFIEIDLLKERGAKEIILTPGNYGEELALRRNIQAPLVKVSNFFGDTLRYVESQGFNKIYLIGHIGKMAKLSIGIFNTHSQVADTRMEAFIYYLALMGANIPLLERINSCITAEEALEVCIENGYGSIVKIMEKGCIERVRKYIRNDTVSIEAIIYSMKREVEK